MAKILIVDDMAVIREPIAGALAGAGHTVLCAAGGVEGLAMALAERPDLMLLDVNMPGMDGLACLAALRRHLTPAQLPVLLLTGDGDRNRVVQAAKLGAQGYLLKSQFTLPGLFARIAQHLKTPAAQQEPSPPSARPPGGAAAA